MAKPLKENGVKELEAFQTRLRRQYTLKRIRGSDYHFLESKTQELIDRVNRLDEIDDDMIGDRSGK